jgi:hypothetical protein
MAIALGPILHATQSPNPEEWCFAIQLTVDAADAPNIGVNFADEDVRVGPQEIATLFPDPLRLVVLRYAVAVPRKTAERIVSYAITGMAGSPRNIDSVAVPAVGELPRIATFSCNGFMHARDRQKVKDPAKMWTEMKDRHTLGIFNSNDADNTSGFHLLIGGGDQVYADENPTVIEAHNMSKAEQDSEPPPDFFAHALKDYVERYIRVFGIAEIAHMMARVPGIYTWDDHDIMDGWGSQGYEDAWVFQEVYEAARRAFEVFQVGGANALVCRVNGAPGRGANHYLQYLKCRETTQWLDIVLLDLRSHRTKERVLSDEQWASLHSILAEHGNMPVAERRNVRRHILVISSIPLVYLRYPGLSRWVATTLDSGNADDLLDQWEHPAHQGERARLLNRLLEARAISDAQVTLISGDVHVAALGRVVSERREHLRVIAGRRETNAIITQITTSAIVNAPPSGIEMRVIELGSSDGKAHCGNGVYTELLDVDNHNARLAARNFVSIGFDRAERKRGQMWIEWVAEDQRARQQFAISP